MQRLAGVLLVAFTILLVSSTASVAGDPVGMDRATNSGVITDYIPWSERVDGVVPVPQSIVVYSDDYCFGNDYVLQALSNMGLGYDLFYADPAGLALALQGGGYDIVLVNHNLVLEPCLPWRDVYNALMGGAKVAVATFDADGSNDVTGFMDDLYMAIGADGVAADVDYPNPVYGWLCQRFVLNAYSDICATVFDDPDTNINCYIDDGDELIVYDYTSAVQGWTREYDEMMGATVNRDGDCGSVFIAWLPDNFRDDDNRNDTRDSAELWMNIIQGFLTGATATETETWGGVKALYR